jgi:glucokinase
MDVGMAIDIGGTKLAVGLVDDNGQVLTERRARTEVDDPWPGLAALVADVLASAPKLNVAPKVSVVGVGTGGPMTAGGEQVSPLNIAGWRDFPLRSRLTELTQLPVFIDNDAKALALGEGWLGAAAGCRNFIGMVVSTGVGGGIVLDGRLLDGADGNAGHIGHVIVEPHGRACACGGRGCLEGETSGLAIAAITGRPAAEAPPDIVERAGRLVGRAVASVCNLLDMRLAVVAGSVALGYGAPFFAAAQRELDGRARIEFARGARIMPAGLGAQAALIGAAAVGWRGLGRDLW